MANWSNPFPAWGDTGDSPTSNFQYDGGDQVNEKHLDYLWDQVKKSFDNVLAHSLQDDGSVKIDNGATAIPFSDDAGADETLFNLSVTSTPTAGTEQSVIGKINGSDLIEFYSEADGSGGIQNSEVRFHVTLDVNASDIVDGNTTIWDSSGHIEQSALENSSLTVTAGDGLQGGGSVALGASTTVNIDVSDFAGTGLEDDGSENLRIASTAVGDGLSGGSGSAISVDVSDFAGTFLSDDGSENLQVDIGTGVENDGSDNIRLDEDYSATWTSSHTFNSGLTANGNVNISGSQLQLDGNTALQSVAASGQVTLSSGSAVVDTGISTVDATFSLFLGVDDPDADTQISGRLFWDDSVGTYHVEILESGTTVGNPTVNYDILRCR